MWPWTMNDRHGVLARVNGHNEWTSARLLRRAESDWRQPAPAAMQEDVKRGIKHRKHSNSEGLREERAREVHTTMIDGARALAGWAKLRSQVQLQA